MVHSTPPELSLIHIYFSYNGGVTLGPQFNQNTSGDINDWASGATLVQNAFIDSGVVATYNSGSPEYAVLNTLGYDGVGPEPATWVLMGACLLYTSRCV